MARKTIILNFSHPITTAQLAQIQKLWNKEKIEVRDAPAQFDLYQPFFPQSVELVESILHEQDRGEEILVNLPAMSTIAGCVLRLVVERIGHWPPIIRFRREDSALVPRYEIAEIIY